MSGGQATDVHVHTQEGKTKETGKQNTKKNLDVTVGGGYMANCVHIFYMRRVYFSPPE